MGLRIILLYSLICYLFLNQNEVEGHMKLSKEEDLELEERLKHLNKPSVKTIKTKYGDIYDCVDFYEQPSFDHPLLKNHNFHPEMRSASIPRRKRKSPDKEEPKPVKMGLEGGGCPIGTVPIRRTTKDDLIRAKLHAQMHASKITPLTNAQHGTHYAIARTLENGNYNGVGGLLNAWNIPVKSPQYTSGRIKVKNGDESLEAGWTVNPGLYGDNRTHMYIYTNAGQSHCFNAQCGYVQVNAEIPVDDVIDPTSIYNGQQYGLSLSIYRDTINSNWFLRLDDNSVELGFWPRQIFTNLGNTASQAEWGGEVFSPPDVPGPGMGTGRSLELDTNRDAFCGKANVVVNDTIINPPDDMDLYIDNDNFDLTIKGDVGGDFRYLVFYGGVEGATGN